jgi:hypothetical protein
MDEILVDLWADHYEKRQAEGGGEEREAFDPTFDLEKLLQEADAEGWEDSK